MQSEILKHYQPLHTHFDEMLEQGAPRAHWRKMLEVLAHETPQAMQRRLAAVQRQVRENGVTYNVYADPQGSHRPWQLDALPFILPQAEWQQIEAAVIQRANLLNHVLQDLYGPQHLLSEGVLPARLVFDNPAYLRPCHGLLQGQQVALHTYAVDLARNAQGEWLVTADRAQAPSGAAYALENRNIIARAYPDLYRELKVRDLARFFSTQRDSLEHWGRMAAAYGQGSRPLRDSEQPLMALLTPGPYNETYSEQSYLARHLGFVLVEGSDLTVRNGMVYMKTLSGLQRVHVILRRLDDDYCDPLELRADSTIGVAGLTEAARRGNVVLANGLGANLLESGVLKCFLPQLCERVLGEPLKLRSVTSWWCGEEAGLAHALAHIRELVWKPAFINRRQAPQFGDLLDQAGLDDLRARIAARPGLFVAQEQAPLSQAPVWQDGLQAGAVGLRVFACATPNGYLVMPGGLTRAAADEHGRVINMQQGGASKDTWVIGGSRPGPLHLLHHATSAADLNRGDAHLSSRIVDNFFWFGRYAERAEHMVRLSRCALDTRLQLAPGERSGEWSALLQLCEHFGLLPAHLVQQEYPESTDVIEEWLIQSVTNPRTTGLASNLQTLFNVAFHLRERLSLDNWRMLNQMVQQFEAVGNAPTLLDAQAVLEHSATALFTLSGFALDGMTRDQGWRFLSLGRWIERVQFLCNNLLQALRMPPGARLDWLLELADSIVTYRARYMAAPEWLPTLDLLLLDDTNPRAIVFQLNGLAKYLRKLEAMHGPCGVDAVQALHHRLASLHVDSDLHQHSSALEQVLLAITQGSEQLAHKIEVRFFSNTEQHAAASQ
ncbi:circularly permuted type 2 ATP-grasp protein [Massilia sp. W12]|uniref:circularly permuted type 2 ATP-grasp protein n=1 Tax=Massilia sp. W12 TaxID=3126507 RepID=UPI0030D5482E